LPQSTSKRRSVAESFSWIEPYWGSSKNDLSSLVAEVCECHELRLLAKYHFVRTQDEFQNTLLRDCSIAIDTVQSQYLTRRWEKFYGQKIRKSGLSLHQAAARDGRYCQYCLRRNCPLEVHHVIPREKKGSDSPSNLVLACPKCNKQISATIALPRNWWELHPESVFNVGMGKSTSQACVVQLSLGA
jgi:5-methylcytosine-specific restriction endonuclease McrA